MGEGARVLLVDDNEALRRILVRVLEQAGYRATDAATASEADARLVGDDAPFDLVVCDVNLPDSVRAFLSHLRDAYPNVPILLISGVPQDYAEHRAGIPVGPNFLQKPFMPQDLVDRVAELTRLPPPPITPRLGYT